jgi:hypothetical protein
MAKRRERSLDTGCQARRLREEGCLISPGVVDEGGIEKMFNHFTLEYSGLTMWFVEVVLKILF